LLLLLVMQLTVPILLRNSSNKTQLLYMPFYLAGTARWRETGVRPKRMYRERIKVRSGVRP